MEQYSTNLTDRLWQVIEKIEIRKKENENILLETS